MGSTDLSATTSLPTSAPSSREAGGRVPPAGAALTSAAASNVEGTIDPSSQRQEDVSTDASISRSQLQLGPAVGTAPPSIATFFPNASADKLKGQSLASQDETFSSPVNSPGSLHISLPPNYPAPSSSVYSDASADEVEEAEGHVSALKGSADQPRNGAARGSSRIRPAPAPVQVSAVQRSPSGEQTNVASPRQGTLSGLEYASLEWSPHKGAGSTSKVQQTQDARPAGDSSKASSPAVRFDRDESRSNVKLTPRRSGTLDVVSTSTSEAAMKAKLAKEGGDLALPPAMLSSGRKASVSLQLFKETGSAGVVPQVHKSKPAKEGSTNSLHLFSNGGTHVYNISGFPICSPSPIDAPRLIA